MHQFHEIVKENGGIFPNIAFPPSDAIAIANALPYVEGQYYYPQHPRCPDSCFRGVYLPLINFLRFASAVSIGIESIRFKFHPNVKI